MYFSVPEHSYRAPLRTYTIAEQDGYGRFLDDVTKHVDIPFVLMPLKQGMPGLYGVNFGYNQIVLDDSLDGLMKEATRRHEYRHNTDYNERSVRNFVNTLFGKNVEPGYLE